MDRWFWLEKALENLKALMGQSVNVNEEDTKRLIVEPLLAWIGYDVWGPGEVKEQYKIEKGGGAHVDYALMKPESATPYLLIEAKPLEGDIFAQVEQIIDYCNYSKGARFGVITNGERWLILDEHWKERAARERKIYDFTLNQKIGEHSGYHVLLLLHPEHEKVWSQLVDKIRKLWETGVEEAIEAVIDKALEKIRIPTGEQKPSVPKESKGDGIAMGEWPKDLRECRGKAPPDYVFIEGERITIGGKTWKKLLVEVARWLKERGKIHDCKDEGRWLNLGNKEGKVSTVLASPRAYIEWSFKLLEKFGDYPRGTNFGNILKPPADWKP